MSKSRRIRRARERESERHFAVFGDLLMGFYEFLEKTPKPSDNEVRAEFVTRENTWKQYCRKNNLTTSASLLFNKEVSQSWERRYKKQPKTEKVEG